MTRIQRESRASALLANQPASEINSPDSVNIPHRYAPMMAAMCCPSGASLASRIR